MSFEIWTIIGFLGAAQALVVGVALLTTRDLRRRLYGLVLTDLGLAMGLITYDHSVAWAAPWVGLAEDTTGILAPPLFYLFVLLVSRGEDSLGALGVRRLALHLALPAAWLPYAAALLAGLDGAGRPPIEWIVAYQVAYTGASGYRAFAPAAGPDERDGTAERWLRLARISVGLFLAIHAAQAVRFFVDRSPWDDIVPVTSAAAIFALTLVAAQQSRLFAPEGGGRGAAGRSGPKYEGSTLTDEQAERGLERLREALAVRRLHLRHDLTLEQLAAEVGLPRTHLSQLINERLGTSFLELLAERRVEEAKRLLADPALEHLTVEAVGGRAGFQSRSAFYDAFKRRTGRTPGAYRKRAARQGATDPRRRSG